MINLGVIGYGYWGPNLVRNFVETKGCRVIAVSDASHARLEAVQSRYPSIRTSPDYADLLRSEDIDAIAVATPPSTHFEIVMKAIKAGKSVVFLGDKENGARYFNCADVAVLMPTQPEAFGFVLLEAMSRKKPVLASRLGGICEVVENKVTGYLVDPLDYDAVADAIVRLTGSASERSELGEEGYNRWKRLFTAERMQDDYRRCLESLLLRTE